MTKGLADEFEHDLSYRLAKRLGTAIDSQYATDHDSDAIGHALDIAQNV